MSPTLTNIRFPQNQRHILLSWKIPDLVTCKIDGFTVSKSDMTTNDTRSVELGSHEKTFRFRKITQGNKYEFRIVMRRNGELSKAAVLVMSIIQN